MNNISKKIKSLPNSPGVYIFKNKTGTVLYVGKATSLKDRVSSYFYLTPNPSPSKGEGSFGIRPIEIMISEVADISIKKTDTVLEAYILEQDLIKKLQPKYNAMGKDDKSFCYVVFTKEEFPKFEIFRGREQKFLFPTEKIYGPYTSKKQIEIALKILRKIFPYHNRPQKTEKGCLDYQIGLCPGPYDGAISKEDYAKNILGIRMVLEGKKKNLLSKMKKEMENFSKKREYEKAAELRNKIFALQHIQDVALISNRDENFEFRISNLKIDSKLKIKNSKFRIEGYDISNISGKFATGSMVVFDNSSGRLEPNKNEYRKFRIKTIEGANDVGAMEEMLMRRFKNSWPLPNLIILDGGKGHLNMARRVLRVFKYEIPILAVAKGLTRKKLDIYSFGNTPDISKEIVEQIRNEAHRFAINYHRKLRSREAVK